MPKLTTLALEQCHLLSETDAASLFDPDIRTFGSKKRSFNDRTAELEVQDNRVVSVDPLEKSVQPHVPSNDGEGSTYFGLSSLIDQFSAYSVSHKRETAELMTLFSTSAISTTEETASAQLQHFDKAESKFLTHRDEKSVPGTDDQNRNHSRIGAQYSSARHAGFEELIPLERYRSVSTEAELLYSRVIRRTPTSAGLKFVKSVIHISNSYHTAKESFNVLSSLEEIIESCHAAGDLVTPSYILGYTDSKLLWLNAPNYAHGLLEVCCLGDSLCDLASPSWDPDSRGWNHCSKYLRTYLVASLLRNHADPNVSCEYTYKTPPIAFAHATHIPNEDMEWILETLIKLGARVEMQDPRAETALHFAVRFGNIVATKTLIKHGASVRAENSLGFSVLALAKRRLRMVKEDSPLYAKIATCMALIIDAGAVDDPGEIME